MSLQIMYGLASVDHLSGVADRIKTIRQKRPNQQVYYIVPNHIKFQSEVQLLQKLNDQKEATFAETQVQILSISRLAWFFLKNTPIYQYPRLTNSSINMLLYKIIQKNATDLLLFKNADSQLGLISEIAGQLSEFKRGNISPDDLERVIVQVANRNDVEMDLAAKLHDLNLIYTDFSNEIDSRYIDNSDLIKALIDELGSQNLNDVTFVVSGFSTFSAEESQLIRTLIQAQSQVIIDITSNSLKYLEPAINDLFYETKKLANDLTKWAKSNGYEVNDEVKLSSKRHQKDGLEAYWIASNSTGREPEVATTNTKIFTANSRYAEVEYVATLIRQKMSQNPQIKFNDFIVMTPNLDEYDTVIKPIFSQFEIPIFYDLQISMKDHPLIEVINSLFGIKRSFYNYEDIMRFLKNGLIRPTAIRDFKRKVAVTENFVLKEGTTGRQWLQKKPWEYRRLGALEQRQLTESEVQRNQDINEIKNYVNSTLPPFFEKVDNAKNGIEVAKLLYQFLLAQGVDQELLNWRDQAIEQGNLSKGAEPEQAWETFIQLLDEFVEILGDDDFNVDSFVGFLDAGFEVANFSQVPSTLDQVLVTESGMVQMADRKYGFFIGATDRNLPAQPNNQELISEESQKVIETNLNEDQFLSFNSQRKMQFEPFRNYLNFMIPSDQIIFSYPQVNNDGSEIKISPYVERIKNHFKLQIRHIESRPTIETTDTIKFIGSQRSTLSHLVQYALDAKKSNVAIDDVWKLIYSILERDGLKELTNKLLSSLGYQNVPTKLSPDIVKGLYGDTILASVSKLEEFYRNEYAYFLKYGLRLKERETADLSPADTGEYFHAAMDQLVKKLSEVQFNLKEIDQKMVEAVVEQVLDQVNSTEQFNYFSKTHRMQYLQGQLDQTVREMVQSILKQISRTKIRPIASEKMFGQIGLENGLPPLDFKINDYQSIKVRGKIDRIDDLKVDGQNYLGIVDYKSSKRKFDFSDAYYGLAMQMLLYLDVVERNKQAITGDTSASVASALYMTVTDPFINAGDSSLKQLDLDQIRAKQFKEHKLEGLMINDEDFLKNIDVTLENGNSDIFPISINKNGSLAASTLKNTLSVEELQLLIRHAERLIQEAGERIFDGELDLNPVRWDDKKTALQYSPYLDVMQFDAMLSENRYREVKRYNKNDIIKLINGEEE